MSEVGALYVHVPFCARKCLYCDFASSATRSDDPCLDAYVAHRLDDLARAEAAGLLASVTTAYVGGGTPTFLGARRVSRLADAIRRACPKLVEFSCEANPDSLSDDVLAALVDAGVTRVSIGVQSLDDGELEALGRIHSAEQARSRVRKAVASGVDVSVDLMCAIPLQTDESWDRTLREVVSLGVGHVSVYPLAIEEGTPFGRRFAHEPTPFNDEDVQAERMEAAERVLTEAGLARYEVASYARPHRQCAHNVAYWTGVPYLGIGRGAASMLGADAFESARAVHPWLPPRTEQPHDAVRMRYVVPDGEVEYLDAREAWAEDLMLGMRLTQGIDEALLDEALLDEASRVRDDLLGRGLVERRDGRLVPTHEGWLLGNELFGALWDLAG